MKQGEGAARRRRTRFAAPLVITATALAPGCTRHESKPAPRSATVVDAGEPATTRTTPDAGTGAVVGEVRIAGGTVRRDDASGICTLYPDDRPCPDDKDCNPPRPRTVPCPPELAPTGPYVLPIERRIEQGDGWIVLDEATLTCELETRVGTCPPKARCNPPPPRAVACPPELMPRLAAGVSATRTEGGRCFHDDVEVACLIPPAQREIERGAMTITLQADQTCRQSCNTPCNPPPPPAVACPDELRSTLVPGVEPTVGADGACSWNGAPVRCSAQ